MGNLGHILFLPIWKERKITITTTKDRLYWWEASAEFSEEYDIQKVYVRDMSTAWYASSTVEWNIGAAFLCSLYDIHGVRHYIEVISASQVIKEADSLVLNSQLDKYVLNTIMSSVFKSYFSKEMQKIRDFI